MSAVKVYYHLPGLFEFYEFYKIFFSLFYEHREYFYDWCDIGSVYGAPSDCIWGGGRVGFGECTPNEVFNLMRKYNISARLTFSNSFLKQEHLTDKKCNSLCSLFNNDNGYQNGIIIYSDLLLDYLKTKYKNFYYISSTTKVITEFDSFISELNRDDFSYVVPDFRLNKCLTELNQLSPIQKNKVEFLCNEDCWIYCAERKKCYENVSLKCLGENCEEHICKAPNSKNGYMFSHAMKSPAFIGIDDILNIYVPMGFSNFKIEGRGLGSALILEFLLYYMVKPEYYINVREQIYLDNMLDLF